ncbi:MAG: hypothetical protein NUV72_02455 [Bauldia sp.]|nr:hypothetical protein [Bauldia sp.]
MAMFLGYDPGGRGRHGVAFVNFDGDGRLAGEPETALLADASDVLRWMKRRRADAMGIDTLLTWSWAGRRACDVWLRQRYAPDANSIIQQNALYSSMLCTVQ